MVRISKFGLNLMRQMDFIKEWADAGLDLVPVSERTMLSPGCCF